MKIIKSTLLGYQSPCVISPTVESENAHLNEIVSWLSEERRSLEKELQRKGAILLRGFKAIQGAEAFETVISAFSSQNATDEGSTSPRTLVQNQIYTSTNAPSYLPIELHQERSFHTEFPDKIAFFCDVAPSQDGETPIADMRAVYQALPLSLIKRFEEKGIKLRRRLPTKNWTRNKAVITWQETFDTDNRHEVESIVEKLGWQLKWNRFSLEVDNCVCPASITHPLTGDRVWFNQAHVLHKTNLLHWAKRYGSFQLWTIALLAPIFTQFYYYHHVFGDNSEINSADLDTIRQAISSQEIRFCWQQGDILLLDNIIMAHGRRIFNGRRRILVTLIKG
ncbi:TauD/TfdA family dioxygenase [Anabaena sp. UHCC 0399]|uniref:TauD/TfdA family dioxygenase n=1 Tax=Anabaena sp. UHCC 0399 TaxID=3110238 RepID=UPI002B1EF6C3|nr:TauD/TfdA family dioxygenase [Anabaena sp. UHCC 0399]MEA5565013.1 TauD/TfdA family dioxygenase [Anabaena sp. UHCC 0399]